MKYLIIADIHGNLPALKSVLEEEPDWDKIVFLGDAVDAGPHPNEVLSTLSELNGIFIMGNHDDEITESPDSPPKTSRSFPHWTNNTISEGNRQFIRTFGTEQRLTADGMEISDMRLHHGDFSFDHDSLNWSGRLWPDSESSVFETLADRYDESIVLSGHSHVQFERFEDGTRFINPGSVGQHRLQHKKACYAVLEDGVFELKATVYDVEKTIEAMYSLPLPEKLIQKRNRVYKEGVIETDMRDFTPLREAGYR